jgi:hypothetical protein
MTTATVTPTLAPALYVPQTSWTDEGGVGDGEEDVLHPPMSHPARTAHIAAAARDLVIESSEWSAFEWIDAGKSRL